MNQELRMMVRCYSDYKQGKKQTETETLLKTAGFSEEYICALKKSGIFFLNPMLR